MIITVKTVKSQFIIETTPCLFYVVIKVASLND